MDKLNKKNVNGEVRHLLNHYGLIDLINSQNQSEV